MADLIHTVLPMPLRKIVYINADSTLKECITLMAEMNIGALVVLDKENKLLGILSERDIVFSCLHQDFDIHTTKALDIVYTKVTILHPHDIVDKAMQAMINTKRRHVLVQDKDRLIAILSIGDMLFHILEDKNIVIKHLEHYIYT